MDRLTALILAAFVAMPALIAAPSVDARELRYFTTNGPVQHFAPPVVVHRGVSPGAVAAIGLGAFALGAAAGAASQPHYVPQAVVVQPPEQVPACFYNGVLRHLGFCNQQDVAEIQAIERPNVVIQQNQYNYYGR